MAKWDKTEKPWERQKKESAQAFEAFTHYLKQGEKRSLRKVARELSKSETLIKRWSSTWSWQERIRQYTNELHRKEFEEERQRAKEIRKRQRKLAESMEQKGFKALQKLDPETIYAKDAIRLITEGIRLERELQQETLSQMAVELGMNGGAESLADTIVAAYQQRMEHDEE